ncbi:MAG: alpha/beta hydrolase [Hyphomicrobiaceae bacterium]|nr:alpha/beta hydrolase [Hyphomicrobiaceae bacterium]
MLTGQITKRVTALLAAMLIGTLGFGASAHAQHIEKIEGKSLRGAAYARLRNLTYAQCEQRCLADARCVALEHYRGGGLIRRSSNCALFSSTRQVTDSSSSDIGYKRGAVAGPAHQKTARSAKPGSPGPSVPTPLAPEAPRVGDGVAREEAAGRMRQAAAQAEERQRQLEALARSKAAAEMEARRQQAEALSSNSAGQGSERARTGAPRSAPYTSAPGPGPAVAAPGPRPRLASEAPPPAAGTRGIGGVAPPAAVAPAAPAAAPPAEYHVVPVYYGTDRTRKDTAKRIAYANDRARRLELGQALITVPANHKVPNIERPSAWTIPWLGTVWQETEDPRKHFTVKEIKAHSKAELLELIKKRLGASQTFKNQSIVFIHGYNVGFDDALYRTAQISYDLQFDGATYTYSWPSGNGWTSYPYDQNSAQQAEPFLYEFLQMVQNETGTESINIIAHSMGNQLLLQVLRDLKRRSPEVSKINQIILAAPDVDRDSFEFLAGEIRGIAKGITLYAASNDKALEASRLFAGRPRAGDVPPPPEGPVVVSGIDTIDITKVTTAYLALNHSSFAEHSDLLTDLQHLIRTGVRPPSQRIGSYKIMSGAKGDYWFYDK